MEGESPTLIVLAKGTNYGFHIVEYKNISSKFTLQTQTKYKNTKTQNCLQELLAWISAISQKIFSAKVSCCQNSDIREVSIALV